MSGERLTLWWISVYTRGLPDEVQQERRAELKSDLWEQRAALGNGLRTGLSISSRCIRGALSDLSWRRAVRGRRRLTSAAITRGLGWAFAGMSYAFFVAGHAWSATALVGLELYGATWDPADIVLYAWISAVLLTLLLAGGIILPWSPALGACLVGLGAFGTAVAFWWGAFIYGPCALAMTTAVVVLARRRHDTRWAA